MVEDGTVVTPSGTNVTSDGIVTTITSTVPNPVSTTPTNPNGGGITTLPPINDTNTSQASMTPLLFIVGGMLLLGSMKTKKKPIKRKV